MLTVEDINVYYGAIHAIKGISLDVPDGEIVALIGSNGAGKSTTLRTISGLMKPKTGKILYEGHDIAGVPAHKIVGMGLCQVPEGRHVFANMTVMENLELGAYLRKDKDGIARDMDDVFKKFPRLLERKDQLSGTLSGGEQQMLAMGRALMSRPKLLLLDEHTAALDPATAEKVLALTKSIVAEKKITCLMVTHNMHQALELGNRTLMMDAGRIVFDVKGAARSKMTVDDLLEKFRENAGKNLDNDRILLSKVEK